MSTTNNQQARTVQPSNEVLQEGLAAAEKGYSVFFVSNKIPAVDGAFYAATQDLEEIVQMARRCGVVKGLAIATGSGFSDVVVIDADSKEAYDWMVERYGQPHVKTRRGGHWYFFHPKDGKIKTVSKYDANKLLDCKGDQGLVEAPPSKGKSWTNGIPDKSTLRALPEELRPPKVSRPSREEGAQLSEEHYEAGVDVLAENYPPKGVRHEAGLPLAGFMGRNGVGEDDALNVVMDARERLPEQMTEKTERSIAGVIRSTYEKLRNGDEDVTGGPTLDRLVPGLPEKLAEALGLDEQAPETEEDRRRIKEKAAEEAWGKCADLASHPNITADFATTLHTNGVAGESKQIRLLYLALVSRLLDKQVNVAVKGPSSGGKSYLIESVLKAFPESAYYDLSTMSEKALIYLDEDMRHRFLVIAEASGMQGDMQSYLIRTLLSEGRIRYQTAESTAKGVRPRLLEMEGPTGLLISTTATRLHPENETRLFSLLVTDTPDQTKAVFKALAEQKRKPASMEQWRALQTWLEAQRNEVVVPFAPALAELVPPIAVRLRRDFKAALQLVKTHAVLHQAERNRDEDGWIIAEYDDYRIVRELVEELIAEGVGAGVSDTVRETVHAVKALTADEDADDVDGEKITTAKKVASHLKIDKSAASRRIKAAVEGGYLKDLREHKNRPQKLAIGDPLPEKQTMLPELETLQAKAEELGCWVAQQNGGIPSEGPNGGSGLQNGKCNPSQPNNPNGDHLDNPPTKHYRKNDKTPQEEPVGVAESGFSAKTRVGSERSATEQPSTKKGLKKRRRRATQPTVQPSNPQEAGDADLLAGSRVVYAGKRGPGFDVYIGRAGRHGFEESYFANPYKIDEDNPREAVLASYEQYLHIVLLATEEGREKLEELRGKTLGCWCAGEKDKGQPRIPEVLKKDDPLYCHGQVLLKALEEVSDPDPLVRLRARRERRKRAHQEALRSNNPDLYHELPADEQERLRAWVRENVEPQRRPRSSYELKHKAERDIGGLGYYVSNAAMKGAMLEAGYTPLDTRRERGINFYFQVGPKPGSTWAVKEQL